MTDFPGVAQHTATAQHLGVTLAVRLDRVCQLDSMAKAVYAMFKLSASIARSLEETLFSNPAASVLAVAAAELSELRDAGVGFAKGLP